MPFYDGNFCENPIFGQNDRSQNAPSDHFVLALRGTAQNIPIEWSTGRFLSYEVLLYAFFTQIYPDWNNIGPTG